MPRSIAFVLFDGAEELDFAGPWEVLSYTGKTEADTCSTFIVSERGGAVTCAKGMKVLADHDFASCPRPDIILVPGGMGTRTEVDNPAMIDFLKRVGADCEIVTSVCTGAFLLERAGFLTGRRAVTHWASMDRLRALGTVTVVEQRYADEGNAITAAGVSAGIDMALHLVGRLWGPELARRVQKGIEYFPSPPYADVPIPALAV
ncbi:MAG: DJ-1/PfpI family protein [Dehalococcoidia bacterium]